MNRFFLSLLSLTRWFYVLKGTSRMGSQYFIDHLPREIASLKQLQVAIIMDLMGGIYWDPLTEVIFAAGAEKSPRLYRDIRQSVQERIHSLSALPLGIHLLEEVPVVGHIFVSDYNAFRKASVPFIFLSSGRTPHYHQTTDLPETLYYERIAATVKWIKRLVWQIDQKTKPYQFKSAY